MAPIIYQPPQEPASEFAPLPTVQLKDVPGLMADRVGELYAAEERAERLARTERMIREAEKTD
jgi:hypothetical protein